MSFDYVCWNLVIVESNFNIIWEKRAVLFRLIDNMKSQQAYNKMLVEKFIVLFIHDNLSLFYSENSCDVW